MGLQDTVVCMYVCMTCMRVCMYYVCKELSTSYSKTMEGMHYCLYNKDMDITQTRSMSNCNSVEGTFKNRGSMKLGDVWGSGDLQQPMRIM